MEINIEEHSELQKLQIELRALYDWLGKKNKRLVILVEGRDTAGKGRFIKAFREHLNEKHVRSVALPKPSNVELKQNYFQRYMSHLPGTGEIVLYDRSWYNRSMVEPVLGFCTKKEHKEFLSAAPNFENLITYDGKTILIKLYFSISKDTQRERLEQRQIDPLRSWKFSTADMQALDKYDDYTGAKYTMLKKTSTVSHPWTIVRANNREMSKMYAIRHILSIIDYPRKDENIDLTIPEGVIVDGKDEIRLMNEQKRDLGNFAE